MAYFSQAMKKEKAPTIRAILKKYGMKGTMAVHHHSSFVVNIKSGILEFDESDQQVNEYHIDNNYTGIKKVFLNELKSAMMVGNHNNNDIITDYFDVGWYIDINIGQWDKPYICTK